MEHLTDLMAIVDSQSDILTEGTYIQMCNCLKKVHDHLVNPMQDSDDEFNVEFIRPRVDDIIRDIDRVELEIVRLDQDLKVTETSLKKLKLINRITSRVKQAAIEDVCNSDRRLVGGGDWTFENLAKNYTNVFWFQTEAERTHFVSTLNEARLYQSYKKKFNERVSTLIGEAQHAKLDIEVERHRLVEEHNRLTESLPSDQEAIYRGMELYGGPDYDWDSIRSRPVSFLRWSEEFLGPSF